MPTELLIRSAAQTDIARLGAINAGHFSGNGSPEEGARWMNEWFKDPAYRIFSADLDNYVVGYIVWRIDGGWNRPDPLTELQQIIIEKPYEGRGFGSCLIRESLCPLGKYIRSTNNRSGDKGTIIVWTEVLNPANALYRKFFTGVGGYRVQYFTPDGKAREENMLRGDIEIPTA